MLLDLYGLTEYNAVRGSSGKGIVSPAIDATNEHIQIKMVSLLFFVRKLVPHGYAGPAWSREGMLVLHTERSFECVAETLLMGVWM